MDPLTFALTVGARNPVVRGAVVLTLAPLAVAAAVSLVNLAAFNAARRATQEVVDESLRGVMAARKVAAND